MHFYLLLTFLLLLQVWHSFSRFQRNLLTALFFFTLCSSVFLISSFYVRARITSSVVKTAKVKFYVHCTQSYSKKISSVSFGFKVLDENVYREKARFPVPTVVKESVASERVRIHQINDLFVANYACIYLAAYPRRRRCAGTITGISCS